MYRLFHKLTVYPIYPGLNVYPFAPTFVSSTGMSSVPGSPVTPQRQVPVPSRSLIPTLRAIEPQIRREWDVPGLPQRGLWGELRSGLKFLTPYIWPFVPREERFGVPSGSVRTGVQG